MRPLLFLRARYRFFAIYAALVLAGALGSLLVWPEQCVAAVAMLGIGMLAAWIAAWITNRHLKERLHRLRELTDAMVRGKLDVEIEHPPHDDFLKLSDSLERMLIKLHASMQEKEHLRQQLTRNEKLALIGELAATVAHEVNNPLDGLQNATRIIRHHPENEEQVRQLLDMMDAGLHRIEMVVRRLLTMSRAEPLRLSAVRAVDLIDEACQFVQPRLNRLGISLEGDMADPPPFVQADRDELIQALINLMLNAADAMPEGGILTVRCHPAVNGDSVEIEVSDTGRGIDAAHLPHVFDPFFTTKTKGRGTGLGLAVVDRIVKAHEGAIDVESVPGRGTRFTIHLPAVPMPSPPDPQFRSRPRAADRQTLTSES